VFRALNGSEVGELMADLVSARDAYASQRSVAEAAQTIGLAERYRIRMSSA
jgi:hypothetical protein